MHAVCAPPPKLCGGRCETERANPGDRDEQQVAPRHVRTPRPDFYGSFAAEGDSCGDTLGGDTDGPHETAGDLLCSIHNLIRGSCELRIPNGLFFDRLDGQQAREQRP
jgi:hypothetical protein